MDGYKVEVKRPIEFLSTLLPLIDEGHIAFEGDLSHFDVRKITGVSTEETALLRRSAAVPITDFLIFPLTEQNTQIFIQSILP